jgi:hypothetical protein
MGTAALLMDGQVCVRADVGPGRGVGDWLVSDAGSSGGPLAAAAGHAARRGEVDRVPRDDIHQIGQTRAVQVGLVGETGLLGERELAPGGVDLGA